VEETQKEEVILDELEDMEDFYELYDMNDLVIVHLASRRPDLAIRLRFGHCYLAHDLQPR
jgi:hypothetical protein